MQYYRTYKLYHGYFGKDYPFGGQILNQKIIPNTWYGDIFMLQLNNPEIVDRNVAEYYNVFFNCLE